MKSPLPQDLALKSPIVFFIFLAALGPLNSELSNQNASKIKTGPPIGTKIPSFRASDQFGRLQDFDSTRGPKGAIVVFFRSADW